MSRAGKGSAILLAAGSSTRLGFDKILTPLAGRPVLHYSLDALVDSERVDEIVLVTREDLIEVMKEQCRPWAERKPVRVVRGGKERADSVLQGIRAIDPSVPMILVHDAARPLITTEIIEAVWVAAEGVGAAVCARPATDTLKRATCQGKVIETVDRSEFWQMETPQIFRASVLRDAYEQVAAKSLVITDDASAVEMSGHEVRLVAAGELNLKITRPGDWALLELWFGSRAGWKVRDALHQIANDISPLVGYLPLLAKYGSGDEKFSEYHGKVMQSLELTRKQLQTLQEGCRNWFPKSDA